MCLPRLVLPKQCYLVTRRCSERRFFMLPDEETTNAFLYCLAASARRSRVQVIFFLAMSNHYHAGIFDPEGRLPEFLEYFHKLFAKHQNALRGRWENFWSPEQTSVVALLDAEAVLTAMVYTLTNPVKASLVALAHEWPGATSLGPQVKGTSVRVPRPSHFFRPDGPMPDEEILTLALPPFMRDGCPDEFRRVLRERIATVEEREAALRKQEGRIVMGVRALLRQRWSDCPNTEAPRRRVKRFISHQAKAQYREFLRAYQEARKCVLAGLKATFPAGTYWLRRFAGQPCEPLPQSS
jgi:putative transposase